MLNDKAYVLNRDQTSDHERNIIPIVSEGMNKIFVAVLSSPEPVVSVPLVKRWRLQATHS